MHPYRAWLAAVLVIALLSHAGGCRAPKAPTIAPRARVASQPAPVNEVDDAAIWLHPTQPELSLLLLANERRGLEVHNLDGLLIKHVDEGLKPNNVDLVYDFALGENLVDLAVASCVDPARLGVKVWRIDPDKRKLYDATAGTVLPVFDGAEPLGLCTYRSRSTGRCYFFVTQRDGRIEQHELIARPGGTVGSTRVRSFARPDKVEGCVADEQRGVVYFAEENVGVWRYPAEPDARAEGICTIRVHEHGLIPDIEGLALYGAADGQGYLLAVSQGPKGGRSTIKVYERQGDNAFVLTIDPSAEPWGSIERASGIAVTNQPTTAAFPYGILAVNDHMNPNASEDFKLFAWEDIARPGGLRIDTAWSRRP